jgi:hypothetical protein
LEPQAITLLAREVRGNYRLMYFDIGLTIKKEDFDVEGLLALGHEEVHSIEYLDGPVS